LGISKEFEEKSVDGFANFYNGPLKAQDNPDFLAAYQNFLSQNDRVLCLDIHSEVDGKEFMASDKHMSMLEDAGYEFHLVEYDPALNPVIEAYERDEISIDDVRDAVVSFQLEISRSEDPEMAKLISSGAITEEEFTEGVKAYVGSLVDAIESAKAHNVKVRFFDDFSTIGKDMDETDENAHINNPLLRRDDTWDPYIEALTKGAKASLFIGGAHATTSYGIDEYMEARGYTVGTFRISPEIAYDGDVSAEHNELVSMAEGSFKHDSDGFDPSDFVVDLFYHNETKTIEWQKELAERAKLEEMESSFDLDPSGQAEEVIQILGPTDLGLAEDITLSDLSRPLKF